MKILAILLILAASLLTSRAQFSLGFTPSADPRTQYHQAFWSATTNDFNHWFGDATASGTNVVISAVVPNGVWLSIRAEGNLGTNHLLSAFARPVLYDTNQFAVTVTNGPAADAPLLPPGALQIYRN